MQDAPRSRAAEIDATDEARALIESLPRLDAAQYNRRTLHAALQHDIDAFTSIWHQIRHIDAARDAKLATLQALLAGELRGRKVIIFTYYKDTARYLHRALVGDDSAAWRASLGEPTIRRIDSSIGGSDRVRTVENFAPIANGVSEIVGSEREIDILVSTDVLSEGQNLQDCGVLVNYDLHWNPTRMVQRAGRIDRLGTPFDTLYIYNMFPERELEQLLGLVQRLTNKIDVINQTGFLDASVLGEVVTPRDFNTLRRIADEEHQVVEEQASLIELASSEALLAELQNRLSTEAQSWITDLDDGIHSSIQRNGECGVFFYFTATAPDGSRRHFWRYWDDSRRTVVDNRYNIMQLIRCGPETPRFPPDLERLDVYAIQEQIIESIVQNVEERQVADLVQKVVAPEQAIAARILRDYLRHPDYERSELQTLRSFLKQPLVGAAVQQLRAALKEYNLCGEPSLLVSTLRRLHKEQAEPSVAAPTRVDAVRREDLRLVCYEYVGS